MASAVTVVLAAGGDGNGHRQNHLDNGLFRDTSHHVGHGEEQVTHRLWLPFSVIMARGPDRTLSGAYAKVKSVVHAARHDHTSTNDVQLGAGPTFRPSSVAA